jgi:protoporphyrin/coproporphyrin ferrochelatase
MINSTPQKAVILVNLGSPDLPRKDAIRRFLKELLSDPKVMNIPAVLRWIILNFLILPFRPAKIVRNYQHIWTEDGFPLITHSKNLADALSEKLGNNYAVQMVMRYGSPSIEAGVRTIQELGIRDISVLPLFPQYATATTGSALEKVFKLLGAGKKSPQITVGNAFYDDKRFIDCWVKKGLSYLGDKSEHVLFSFHGLPVSQIQSLAQPGSDCNESKSCCDQINDQNKNCYRAQCVQTATKIAIGLGISPDNYTISFQSRLGRTQWLEPYTSQIIQDLASKGVKDLLVFCPSFVADCLETLFEIEVEEKERFISFGGESLTLVPSLNSEESWVETVFHLIQKLKC